MFDELHIEIEMNSAGLGSLKLNGFSWAYASLELHMVARDGTRVDLDALQGSATLHISPEKTMAVAMESSFYQRFVPKVRPVFEEEEEQDGD